MASAGKILIMPKGDWNAEAEYEILDLVKHNGASWLSKKASIGIEPSTDNSEYWMDLFDISTPTAEKIGALSRNGYGYYTGDVDELKAAGTYVVVTYNDSVTGTFPLPSGWWYTVNVFVGGTGSVVQEWILATELNVPIRIFTRHFEGNAWSPYFETVNSNNGAFASDVTIQKADNGKSVIIKNHSDSADYGTEIFDYDATGNYIKLMVKAKAELDGAVGFSKNGGSFYRFFGEHNIDLLKTLMGIANITGGAKIVTGTYTGAGTYTSANPTTLPTLEIEPKLVIILGGATGLDSLSVITAAYGLTLRQRSGVIGICGVTPTFNGENVSFYVPEGDYTEPDIFQMNYSGITYTYIAIG